MFKLVCGAGNEDAESVKRLVYIYSSAGCKLFDISARKEILEAAKEGAKIASSTGVKYCVSVGIKGDPHISKAFINNTTCTACLDCIESCPNSAINFENESINLNLSKCIGCGICVKKCKYSSISMVEKDTDVSEILPWMVKNGVDIIELHIMGHDKDDLEKKWKIINECKPRYASICIDRENFGNKECLKRIREMISIREPFTTIVQADGIPMSGGDDSYKTTLQAVAMAEIIQNANLPVYIMLSGGTNSKTAALAKQCGINYWGIAMGSWARKIIKKELQSNDFWGNNELRKFAIEKAAQLITTSV